MPPSRNWRLEGYAPDAKTAMAGAQALADERSHLEVEPLHVLYRLTDRDAYAQKLLEASGVDPGDLLVEAETVLRRLPQSPDATAFLSTRTLAMTTRAEGEAQREGTPVRVRHLLLALAQEATGFAGAVLRALDLDEARLRDATKSLAEPPVGSVTPVPGETTASVARSGGSAAQSADGDALARFTRDIVADARGGRFDPLVGRDGEIRRMLQILARRQKNNPVLMGDPGIGKRSIVRAVGARLAAGDVPEPLRNRRLLQLETSLLLAGARARGELEDRLRQLLDAAVSADRPVLLFVEDIHALFGGGALGSGPAELLKPVLARGEIQLVGTTTPADWRRNTEKDPALTRLFATIDVATPGVDEAIGITRGIVERYELFHGVKVTDPAVVAAVRFAKRYLADRALPDPAIDLLDEAAARTRLALDAGPPDLDKLTRRQSALEAQHRSLVDEDDADSVQARTRVEKELADVRTRLSDLRPRWERQQGLLSAARVAREKLVALRKERDEKSSTDKDRAREIAVTEVPAAEKAVETADAALAAEGRLLLEPLVTAENVAQVVEQWTGVPVSRMLESETDRLTRMEVRLRERVVGQDPAVHAVAKAVRRGRVGLRDPGRPIGSFFFLGPTGVGKTELAKALAEFLFDDELALVRLDMSEFMEKHMVARLLGSPPGYVDSEEGGMLTEAVRRRPYAVVLFDEVEKAHPDVFNILLQVLDDGRLTDSRGRLTDFSNTVVILTSNVGAHRILDAAERGVPDEELRAEVQDELRKQFRPEFLNRIDDVVIFDRLEKTALRGIVDIQLRRLQRLLADTRLSLDVTDAARVRLTDLGYEPAFGARPLKRVILRELQDPLAQEIIAGTYRAGDTVRVDHDGTNFLFTRNSTS